MVFVTFVCVCVCILRNSHINTFAAIGTHFVAFKLSFFVVRYKVIHDDSSIAIMTLIYLCC